MTKTTKAERIFNQTMGAIRNSIRHHGIGTFDATSLDCNNTDGNICQRTINAVSKLLNSYEKRWTSYAKYLGTDDSVEISLEAVRIMRNTIANYQRDCIDFLKNI